MKAIIYFPVTYLTSIVITKNFMTIEQSTRRALLGAARLACIKVLQTSFHSHCFNTLTAPLYRQARIFFFKCIKLIEVTQVI